MVASSVGEAQDDPEDAKSRDRHGLSDYTECPEQAIKLLGRLGPGPFEAAEWSQPPAGV
jgi:hypothetical protein